MSYRDELCFTILYTNDEHSAILPRLPETGEGGYTCGGFAYLAGAVEQLRKEKSKINEPVLLVNGGDFAGGTPFQWMGTIHRAAELGLMQQIGYDVVTLGNHEMDYGLKGLVRYLKAAGYPASQQKTAVVCSNIVGSDDYNPVEDNLISKNHICELENGLKIGFLGLIGVDAVEVAAKQKEPVKYEDIAVAARKAVEDIQKQGADIIISLNHTGLSYWSCADFANLECCEVIKAETLEKIPCASIKEDSKLCRDVPGINLILRGHCHNPLKKPVLSGDTFIFQTGSVLNYLGIIELAYNPLTKKLRLRNHETGRPFLLPIDSNLPKSRKIDQSVSALILELNQLVHELTGGRFSDVLENVACSDFSLPQEPLTGETLLGNFVTDAMRLVTAEKTGRRVDFSLQANGQFLHCGIQPGSKDDCPGALTFYDLAKVVAQGSSPKGAPGYPIVSICLTGREMWEMLNSSMAINKMLGATFYLQTSGLRLSLDRGEIVKVERYTGKGYQGTIEQDYVLLENNDDQLYHLVADYHILSFCLVMLETMQLDIVLKNELGKPIENIEDCIVYHNNRELTVWQAVVEYAAGQPENPSGYPQIPAYYNNLTNRVI